MIYIHFFYTFGMIFLAVILIGIVYSNKITYSQMNVETFLATELLSEYPSHGRPVVEVDNISVDY